ncbi:MAG: hypothetical protein BMS9Abin05_2276 [Rhodothermia bacterium]|nr:MAG: hypothetical protein BMS9Abin05_2276 [Rhodothermia bacterium]
MRTMSENKKIHGRGDELAEVFYGEPSTISRVDNIRRKSLVDRSDAETAYLEAYDLAETYPRHIADICRAIFDAGRK